MPPTHQAPKDKPRQRKPGRPKAAISYTASIQLRLTDPQLQQLAERAREANCSRSDVLRAAMADGQLAVVRSPAQAAAYRQVVQLDAKVQELARLPGLNQAARTHIQELLQQVAGVLTTLNDFAR